jgi:hypothetical protein
VPQGAGSVAVAASPRPEAGTAARWRRRALSPAQLAFAIYLLGSLLLFGIPVLGDLGHECLCIPTTTDAGVFAWSLEWWPHTLLHGQNPFVTHLIYAPTGFDVVHGTTVPGAALLLAPLTAALGPLASFDLAMLLSPVLAAWCAFLLCRGLTGRFWASLAGGWLFGFSSYLVAQLTGHLDLVLVFPLPLLVLLVLRRIRGELRARSFVALSGLTLALQISFGLELLFSATLFAALAIAASWLLNGAAGRSRLRALTPELGLAWLLALVLVSPYLYYALKPGLLPVLPWRTDRFSNDLLGFVVPTALTRAGGSAFVSTSHRFTAGSVEGGAYLGLPALALVALAARELRSRPWARTTCAVAVLSALLSLGGQLHIAGSKGPPLPWAAVNRLPGFGQALPARFVVYATLATAMLAAAWLARPGRAAARWTLALLSLAALWPATELGAWHSHPDLPRLFSTTVYRQAIRPADTVLALPVGIAGQSMLWQAEARLGFRMAGGYIVAPEATDPLKHEAIYPTLTYGEAVPHPLSAAAEFLRRHRVTVVVMDSEARGASAWLPLLAQLGWTARRTGGALLFRYTGAVAEPVLSGPPPARPVASGAPTAQLAARRLAGRYLHSVLAARAADVCSALTAGARDAQVQRHGADAAQCAVGLRRSLPGVRSFLRGLGPIVVGPAAIAGSSGWVALELGRATVRYLPVEEVGGQWLVNGVARR